MHADGGIADDCETVCDEPVCVYGNQRIGMALSYQFHSAQSVPKSLLDILIKKRLVHLDDLIDVLVMNGNNDRRQVSRHR